MFVEWSPGFSVGIEKIDSEHKKLFDIINELFDSYAGDPNDESNRKIVSELNDYVIFHFNGEERAMRRHNFPDLNEHILQHEEFKRKVKDLAIDLELGKKVDMLPILQFLTDWLAGHIGKMDKAYAGYFAEQGVGV